MCLVLAMNRDKGRCGAQGVVIGELVAWLGTIFGLGLLGVGGVVFFWGIFEQRAKEDRLERFLAQQSASVDVAGEGVAADAGPREDGLSAEEFEHLMTVGQTAYMACAACHAPDGQGVQAGAMQMAATLTGSEIAMGGTERLAATLLNGIMPSGQFAGAMMALPMSDENTAGVMTYIRNSFGNKASAVTAAGVAAAREKFAGRSTPWTRAELDAWDDPMTDLPTE